METRQRHLQWNLLGRSVKATEYSFLLFMGVVIGIVTGIVAVLFRLGAIYGELLFLPHELLVSKDWRLLLQRLLMPAAGGLIVGVILYRFYRHKASHSIPHILRAVASGDHKLETGRAAPPALSILTIASGNSVGAEGPIAELGALLGNKLAYLVQAPPKLIKTLMGAGVAAGISAVFNAPIGGVFFAVEVILRNYEISSLVPIVVAAVVAAVISQLALGNHTALHLPALPNVPMAELPCFALLGIACGLLAIIYILVLAWLRRQFNGLKLPMWLKPAIGGFAVGLIGLSLPQVMGEGYAWVRDFLATPGYPVLLAGLILFKIVATGLTLGSGNPGGTFAPTVFMGALLGSLIGQGAVAAGWAASPLPYAVLGVAGMIAAALGAPLTGAVMIILHPDARETSSLLLPIMLTVSLAMFVMQRWQRGTIYTYELIRGGLDLDAMSRATPLEKVLIEKVIQTHGYTSMDASLPLEDALKLARDLPERWFLVRDSSQHFLGIIDINDLRVAIADPDLGHLLTIDDIVDRTQLHLTPDMRLKDAMPLFRVSAAEVLPVFRPGTSPPEVLGIVTRQSLLNEYLDQPQ